jgi:hypothetical protein
VSGFAGAVVHLTVAAGFLYTAIMKTLMRLWLFAVLAFSGLLVAPVVTAAEKAPVIKPTGFTLPCIFCTASERLLRRQCADNQPECRPSVRKQMEQEMAASLITPWLLLGAGVLGALLFLRMREVKRAKHRRMAQRHHDPRTYRKLDKTREDRAEDAERQRQRDELAH